jgi:hypothetical protein
MPSLKDTAVKYVLYSHFTYHEGEDFEAFKVGTPVAELDGLRHLEQHFRGLRELLTSPGHEGLLVLFYTPGFEEFLAGVVDRRTPQDLVAASESLHFAAEVAASVREKLSEAGLGERVRFITSLDLEVILGRVNTIFADRFTKYFVGPARGIRYDTPKIVEAILRLRLLGNGVPVLRLDHDVIFRFGDGRKVIGDLGLFKAVACALRAYHLRLSKPTVSTFLFSASYNSRDLADPAEPDRFKAWSRAFATRVYPALVVDPEKIKQVCRKKKKKNKERAWDEYVTTHLDEDLAKQFYGLGGDLGALKVNDDKGITLIGAHPLFAVISGALLCLSEGAILDLPPFSNFRHNVTWIDDHLKYSLHRAMGHFTSGEFLDLEPGLSDARLDDVVVSKARPSVSDLPGYVFGTYLPTVLLGCIMDSWITTDPVLKCRVRDSNSPDQARYRDAWTTQDTAPLPSAMLEALRVGDFGSQAELMLRETLQEVAVRRIEEVRQLWYALQTSEVRSFASLWAEGTVADVLPATSFADQRDDIWKGIAPGRAIGVPLQSINQLAPPLMMKLRDLCEDASTYIEWTLEWPKFVQIVRSVPQGTFSGDLSWKRSDTTP